MTRWMKTRLARNGSPPLNLEAKNWNLQASFHFQISKALVRMGHSRVGYRANTHGIEVKFFS